MDPITRFCQENGWPQSIGAAWRARGLADWTPLQAEAWRQGVHRDGEHWLVAGPTSAGKSLPGEAAVLQTLLAGRRRSG